MSAMMEYDQYVARIEIDLDAGILHGQVINLRDVITFQGASIDELRREFANSVEDYRAFCAERGEQPDRPFSGNLMLRMPPDLHRALATCAAKDDSSLNGWIVAKLRECASSDLSTAPASIPVSPARR